MTDREKAIVMAHTGICMLTGDKFQIFHKYVEDIMGRPIWTHEMGIESIANEIKEKSKDDFIALCADESSSEKTKSEWQQDHEILKAYSDGASAVLDNVRAEIESKYESIPNTFHHYETGFTDALEWVLSVIDNYKA